MTQDYFGWKNQATFEAKRYFEIYEPSFQVHNEASIKEEFLRMAKETLKPLNQGDKPASFFIKQAFFNALEDVDFKAIANWVNKEFGLDKFIKPRKLNVCPTKQTIQNEQEFLRRIHAALETLEQELIKNEVEEVIIANIKKTYLLLRDELRHEYITSRSFEENFSYFCEVMKEEFPVLNTSPALVFKSDRAAEHLAWYMHYCCPVYQIRVA